MKIGNNSSVAQTINNNLEQQKTEEKKALNKISNEKDIDGTEGSNLQISDELLSQLSRLGQGVQNANEAVGVLQIADAALANITDSAVQLEEISVRYNSAALNSDQKAMLESEANALVSSMSDALNGATYNGENVFEGSMQFYTGNESIDLELDTPNLSSIDYTDSDNIHDFVSSIASIRSDIGSTVNEMAVLTTNHLSAMTNITESESQLSEESVEENYNEVNKAKLLENAALYTASFNTNLLKDRLSSLLG